MIEGDHGSAYFHPESEAADDAIACLVKLQRGDAKIGRRLYPLLLERRLRQPAGLAADGLRGREQARSSPTASR